MAIDPNTFAGRAGVALMRYDQSLNDWFFEAWASKRTIFRDLGPGNHIFELWVVFPLDGTFQAVRHNAWVRINAVKMRK